MRRKKHQFSLAAEEETFGVDTLETRKIVKNILANTKVQGVIEKTMGKLYLYAEGKIDGFTVDTFPRLKELRIENRHLRLI